MPDESSDYNYEQMSSSSSCGIDVSTENIAVCAGCSGEAKVTVTDCQGEPIEGASVTVEVESSNEDIVISASSGSHVTDEDGCVTISIHGVDEGESEFVVTVSCGGDSVSTRGSEASRQPNRFFYPHGGCATAFGLRNQS